MANLNEGVDANTMKTNQNLITQINVVHFAENGEIDTRTLDRKTRRSIYSP